MIEWFTYNGYHGESKHGDGDDEHEDDPDGRVLRQGHPQVVYGGGAF